MTFVEMLRKNLDLRKKDQHALMVRTFETTKSFEGYLIAVGKFQQLKSDIDVILTQLKKRDPDGDTLDEPQESDDFDESEEEEEGESDKIRRRFSSRSAKNWGG